MAIVIRADVKGTGAKVNLRRGGNENLVIDLDNATKEQLKILLDAEHPFVSEEKKDKPNAQG